MSKRITNNEYIKRVQKIHPIKNKFCKENNIKLLRIPYTEYKNIEELLEFVLQEVV